MHHIFLHTFINQQISSLFFVVPNYLFIIICYCLLFIIYLLFFVIVYLLQKIATIRMWRVKTTAIRSRVLSAKKSSTGSPRWSATPCRSTPSTRRASRGSSLSSTDLTGSTRLPNRGPSREKRWTKMRRTEGDSRLLMIKVKIIKHQTFYFILY